MSKEGIPFVKKVSKSGRGYLLWIPKDVAEYLSLHEDDFVEISLKKLQKNGE